MSRFSIVCPNCSKQFVREIDEGHSGNSCQTCGKHSTALFAKVRAKRSRGNKQAGARDYSIRLLHSGIEDFIEFSGPYSEFEMRAGDWVVFSYDKDRRLAVLQNVTLGRYVEIPKPGNGCLIAFAIVAVVIVALLILGSFGHH